MIPNDVRLEALRNSRLLVMDTETTGFGVEKGARAIEVAAVTLWRGEVQGTFSALIDRGEDSPAIPEEATRVHGITGDHVKRAGIGVETALQTLRELMSGADAWVFHNAAFDLPFIGQLITDLPWGKMELDADGYGRQAIIDTLGLARGIWTGYGISNKLVDVASRLEIAQETAHRALGDALMTARVLGPLAKMTLDRSNEPWTTDDRLWLQQLGKLSESVMRASELRWGRNVDFRASFGLPTHPVVS